MFIHKVMAEAHTLKCALIYYSALELARRLNVLIN